MEGSLTTISRSNRVDIKTLRLAINLLRRAELDFLDPHACKEDKDTAKLFLFGVKGSPLTRVCKTLNINLTAAQLLLLKWKAQGKIGDPIFGYLSDPDNLTRAESGMPLSQPDLESVYGTRTDSCKQERSKRSPKRS